MLKWFADLLRAMVAADCYLQSFHAGYRSDINADNLTNDDLKAYPMLCLVGFFTSTEDTAANSERYKVTLEFLALQGYKNDNTPDINHALVDYFDEAQVMAKGFLSSLDGVFKKITVDKTSDLQVYIVKDSPRNWRRSAFAHNDRCISIQCDIEIEFKTGAFNCESTCDCNDLCIPAFAKPDPNNLLTAEQKKC